MMKVIDFLKQVKKATELKSLYVMGGFGAVAGYGNNRNRYSTNNDYNRQPARQKLIKAASDDTFFFDCVGLCKGILWGWDGLTNRVYGGAGYAVNGVPDYDAKGMMFKGCSDPTTDFSKIEAGEFLWLDGHCGIYIGDGLCAESSPKWKDGVQITAVSNLGPKQGYNSRKWTYHGHLKYVDYSAQPSKYPAVPFEATNILNGVSIRETPYSSGEIIGTIKNGATITVEKLEGSSGDFAKISGYVYLPGGFTWNNSMDGYTVGKTYTVQANSLSVRTAATTSATVVTEIKKGTQVVCKALTKDNAGNTWMRIDKPAAGWIACIYEGNKYVN